MGKMLIGMNENLGLRRISPSRRRTLEAVRTGHKFGVFPRSETVATCRACGLLKVWGEPKTHILTRRPLDTEWRRTPGNAMCTGVDYLIRTIGENQAAQMREAAAAQQ